MTFDDYKFICFTQKINPNIIESCRSFIDSHYDDFDPTGIEQANWDLGYAELANIDSKSKSINAIKDAIFDSTIDINKNGHSLEKVRIKQLIKRPNKRLCRLVLKSFYLFYYDL